ncbi:hypothetical protein ASZ90_019899 [hydrocarbon metagenome]|uniref:Uncharacterized protein n=1 Tax=hydrocarbon metagenome TaxID=938273 RepID=A0A0W8E2N9_9ZZZZ
MLNISEIPGGIRLEIKVQPRSSKNQIAGKQEGALKIKLTAPPVEGEANQALINFLSAFLKIPKRNINLIKGETSRHKLVEIQGIDKDTFIKLIK